MLGISMPSSSLLIFLSVSNKTENKILEKYNINNEFKEFKKYNKENKALTFIGILELLVVITAFVVFLILKLNALAVVIILAYMIFDILVSIKFTEKFVKELEIV